MISSFSRKISASIQSPAVAERHVLEALADERELIANVNAAARLFGNSISDLRRHRAKAGQRIDDATDVHYGLMSEVLLQLQLLETESR